MAKYEHQLTGDFRQFLDHMHHQIIRGSASASYEDGSDYRNGDTQVAVRVYERYSMIGSNRVSLNMTVIGSGRELYISLITSGGSEAVFFKINTFGESAFLERAMDAVRSFNAG